VDVAIVIKWLRTGLKSRVQMESNIYEDFSSCMAAAALFPLFAPPVLTYSDIKPPRTRFKSVQVIIQGSPGTNVLYEPECVSDCFV
jgi:hypothetical protein